MKALKKPLSLLMALLMCFGVICRNRRYGLCRRRNHDHLYGGYSPRQRSQQGRDGAILPLISWAAGLRRPTTAFLFTHKTPSPVKPSIASSLVSVWSLVISTTGRGEDFWDNYPSNLNPTIPPSTIKEYIGRIMTLWLAGQRRHFVEQQ